MNWLDIRAVILFFLLVALGVFALSGAWTIAFILVIIFVALACIQ